MKRVGMSFSLSEMPGLIATPPTRQEDKRVRESRLAAQAAHPIDGVLAGGQSRSDIVAKRAARWLRNNPGRDIADAPRHIREGET